MADHSSGVSARPSRLRSMSGTTNISGDLAGAPDAPCRPVAPLCPRAGARGGADPSDRSRAHRTRRQRPRRARAGASPAALPGGARRGLDELRSAVEGGARARRHRQAGPRQGRLVQAPARQSLYGEAAVRVNPAGADGHFTIGQALGRLSRTKGGKEQVRFAKIIYDEGMKAIELDSTHDGAYHLVGAWHAEVKRLSGFQKFFAKALFGGGFLDKGNWADAQKYLEKAVALKPQNIFHRLDLAEVYVDVGKYSKAREQLTTIATLPIADVLDSDYQKEAAQLLDDIKSEKDET